MNKHQLRVILGWAIVVVCSSTRVHADVTVQQKTSLDVASVIRLHGATTSSIATDKKREDSESHCEGVMSLVCGNVRGGDIVRLDRDVTWHLEPDKKRYREQVFASPEELAAMRAKMQANLEKMRSCPVSQKQQTVDTSKCTMAAPIIEVHKTDDKMAIAGHDTQRTSATLTESCTNKDTGEVCDTVIAVDVWLTQDKLPGTSDRRAFDLAYAKKLGLDDTQGVLRGDVTRYLAPYQAQIKQITDKAAEFKGQPLKTSLRVLMGGQQCSAAKTKTDESAGADPAAGNPMANVAQAGKALSSSVGHLVGGLFHKKPADDASAAASAAGSADPGTAQPTAGAGVASATAKAPDPFAQYVQLGTFTQETVSISTDAIPAERFEVPADWKKDLPKATQSGDDDFTCPKT